MHSIMLTSKNTTNKDHFSTKPRFFNSTCRRLGLAKGQFPQTLENTELGNGTPFILRAASETGAFYKQDGHKDAGIHIKA